MTLHLTKGAVFGELTLLKMAPYLKSAAVNLRRRWRVRCTCGKEFVIPQYYLIRKQPEPKRHCGCQNRTIKTDFNQEYRIWLMMLKRCFDDRHVSYKYYGGRGIIVCTEWASQTDGFQKFLEHIGPRPSLDFSVDRFPDPDGNYQPGNVRWATDAQQAANKSKLNKPQTFKVA